MTTITNIRSITYGIAVPVVFTAVLMSTVFLSVPPVFLALNGRLTSGLLGITVVLLVLFIFLKLERKTWGDYSLSVEKRTLSRFAVGSIAGLLLAGAMFALQAGVIGLSISFTNVDFVRFAWLSLTLIPLAFMEELAFRSYAFIKFKDTYGVWVAQFSIAVLFALYHYVGGWTLYASFAGTFVWSFAFGLLAMKSNGIALPTGFHFGLNLALAAIGSKQGISGLITIDFAESATAAMMEANSYVGGALQLTVFIALLVFTFRYTRENHGKRTSN